MTDFNPGATLPIDNLDYLRQILFAGMKNAAIAPAGRNHRPKVIDLFAGAGGLTLGAERAGMSVAAAVEIDPHALQCHKRNFPACAHVDTDVAELDATGLSRKLGWNLRGIDGVIGGPPCQGFSVIGKRVSEDPRNNMFLHFFRLVRQLRPKFFLAENVPGILAPCYHSLLDQAFSLLPAGYVQLPPLVLKASDYGAPTSRTRVFFLGFRSSEVDHFKKDDLMPMPQTRSITVSDALSGLPKFVDPEWQEEIQSWRKVGKLGTDSFSSRITGMIPEGIGDEAAMKRLKRREVSGFLGTRHTPEVLERFASVVQGDTDQISRCHRLNPKGFCPTLRAGTAKDKGGFQAIRPLHPTEDRVITPREAARLQGFPDWFQFSPTKWHSFRQIGNSVSPILAEDILARLVKRLYSKDVHGANSEKLG